MRLSPAALCLAGAAFLGASAHSAAGQDVELLSQIYGTPLPDGYRAFIAANPGAFQFSHGRAIRLGERLRELGLVRAEGARVGPMTALGPTKGAVTGTFRIPVVLGLFLDSPPEGVPYAKEAVQGAYFSDDPGTITAYYEEVSGGLVTLLGDVRDWTRSNLTRAEATGGKSGLTVGTTGAFIVDLLRKLPPDMDWGIYDNDGPDGRPNSGDDDGFVDALAVLHPTPGAECGGLEKDNRIWSHRWSLRYAARVSGGWATATPSAEGGVIRVDDYVVQPVYGCNGAALNEIGVFTHELGHAFGLPDLYDTNADNGKHQGAGNWELMATGSFGCNGVSPESPCHLSAWSKMVLGWADVQTLKPDTDHGTLTLPAVESTGKIYRIDAADGSREFYLLENRQRLGFDQRLYNDGLLVWRISQAILDAQWRSNEVNALSQLGVWLREADGLNELATPGCARGNAGDPFPFVGTLNGCGGRRAEGENRVFHAASQPSSMSDVGSASGLTLLDIREDAGRVTFRVSTRFARIGVRSEGDGGRGGLFPVNGAPMATSGFPFKSAPFQKFTREAAAGESLGAGLRRPFVAWGDDAQAARVRSVDTPMQDLEMVARYGGEQVELAVALKGGQGDVAPGTVVAQPSAPDLWFAKGTTVTLEARPRRGFAFLRWSGALEGQPNPATLTLASPVQAAAEFELTYRVAAATVRIAAAEDPHLTLEPENGTAPYRWAVLEGTLPSGLELNILGQLTGAAMATGTFPLKVEVSDAIGLKAKGSFIVQVDDPTIPAASLASTFLLTGPALTPPQATYLDRKGNADGTYDIGDFRAWVLAHPGLPLTAPMKALVGRTVVIPMTFESGPEVRR
ncbi:MAG: M6 family metalloprotease domain-containing protein [Longimicrobiales bacterium]|nr:M6 family metalloprotease domain-containing protein [Longimicrobiales bacterium]